MLVGGGEGNKAAKSVTNVRDCVLTFVSVKLLDICEELGSWRSKKVKKNFKPNHVFLNLTKAFLALNLPRALAQSCDK